MRGVPMWIRRRSHCGLNAVLLILSAFLCVVETASPAQAQVAGSSPVYAQNVPDDASTTVGPGYIGLDPAIIIRALQKTGITQPKSEYETSADYQRRISALPIRTDSTEPPLDRKLAFVLNGPAAYGSSGSNGVQFSYDADKQIMNVRLEFEGASFPEGILPTYNLRNTVLNRSEYTGTNAFGATADVTSYVFGGFGLTIEYGTWLTPPGELSRLASDPRYRFMAFERGVTLPLQMPLAVAKDSAGHLRLLFICSLTSPWLRLATGSRSPATIQDPSEGFAINSYLHVNPEAVWIFDERDGKVIAKFTSSSLQADRQRVAQEYERARRSLYPLKLEVALNQGFATGVFSYQIDDQPEQSGPGPYGYIQLPLVIEAKNHASITVRDKDRHEAEAYAKCFVFKLNGVQVKPKWQTGKSPMTHRYEAVATFELP